MDDPKPAPAWLEEADLAAVAALYAAELAAAERVAAGKAAALARCVCCGGPMWCGQPVMHHTCRGAILLADGTEVPLAHVGGA